MGALRPLAAMAFCLALAPTALAQDANDNLNAVLWMQKSVEYKANAEAVFALAKIRLDEALKDKSWTAAPAEQTGDFANLTPAVVADADETVLDNSTYQKERAEQGLAFTADSWDAWVRRVAADDLPGAAAFIARARRLGGRVVIVSNRDAHICDPTRENLRRLEIVVDAVLCREQGVSDKNPRFHAVAAGALPGLPALEVLLWIGDNIQDFPGLSQDIPTADPAAFAQFGQRYFILPNPMYGSWERNPPR